MYDIAEIKAFAITAHGDQKWADDQPYAYHLQAVENVLYRFAPKEVVIHNNINLLNAGAWLHDTLEDTSVTREQLTDKYGVELSNLVYSVTNEPGVNRAERHEKTYPKVKQGGDVSVALKLADRIANVEVCLRTNSKLYKMYTKEWRKFYNKLRTYGLNAMWHHLTGLFIQPSTFLKSPPSF